MCFFRNTPELNVKSLCFMVIKGLLGHVGLLGIRTITYVLTNHRFRLLIIYTMNEKEEIIKEAYEQLFGTAYETYKIAVRNRLISYYKR